VFGLVITRQAPPTAKGMMFVTLEDASGFINLAVRPEVYSEYASLFDREIFLLAEGVLQKNGEVHSLMVKKLYERSEHLAKVVEIENDIFKEVEHDKKNGTTDLSDFKKDGNSFSKKRKQEASSSHRRHPRDVPRFAIRNFH
jgi:error-prone DNA polymerase